MRHRLALLLCLCAGCAVSFGASPAEWSVEQDALVRRGGGTTLTASLPGTVEIVAPRSDGGAWIATTDGLWSVAATGQVRARADMRGVGRVTRLAADPYDGSAWVVTDERLLLRFNLDGTLVGGTTVSATAGALAVGLDQSAWLITGGELLHFSRDVRWLGTRLLAADETAGAFAIDALRNRILFITANGVFYVDTDDAQAPTSLLRGRTSLFALDARRGITLAIVDGTLVAIDANGDVRALERQLAPDEEALALLHDAAEDVFVLETTRATILIASDTQVQQERASTGRRVIGVTPLQLSPALSLLRPPGGGAVTDPGAEIILYVGARCNDVDCDVPQAYLRSMRVDATLDGAPLGEARISAAGRATFPLRGAMTPGENVLDAKAADMFGHVVTLDRARWTLLVDANATAPDSAFVASANGTALTKAANRSPTVSVTSPATGSTFAAGSSITLTAIAADTDGSIAKVEFYRGGTTLIGTATLSPYSFVWTNVAAGSYSVTAMAYDNRKATSVSAPVSITVVDNRPPIVALTSPAPGSFVQAGAIVTMSAMATDPDGAITRVDFLDGSAVIGTAATPPYQAAWNANAPGRHTISARATDDKGGVARSSSVDLIVGEPPVIVVTNPVACSAVDGPLDVTITVDALSTTGTIASVEFFDNGASLGWTAVAPWRATLQHASVGTHTITATATDDHGLVGLARPATFTVRAQNQAPSVTLTAPADGSHFALGAPVDLVAMAADTDGTIGAVEFRLGSATGTLISRTTVAPYKATWTSVTAGTFSIVAVAYDDGNAKAASAPVHVVVDANVLPNVIVTAPVTNAKFTAPATIAVAASASDSDGSIVKVDFYAGTTLVGTSSAAPYAATWSNVAAGAYSLTAKATDNAGGVTTSAPVLVSVVANVLPTVVLTAPATGKRYFAPATISVSADASDSDGTIAGVDFLANGIVIGHASSAPFRAVWDGVVAGNYAITAKAIDNAGGSALSAPVDIAVDGAPSLQIDAALSGATIGDDNVLVRGVVSAPANSSVTVNGIVTHIDDLGRFQANDVPLAPGSNTITAIVTSQDGQTTSQSIGLDSTGPGAFVVQAAPTEGLESLDVTFTIENAGDTPFKQLNIDLDNDGSPNAIVTPGQLADGKLTLTATYPVGTWVATIKAYDDQDNVIYSTSKSIVVRLPQALQSNLRAIYDGMLTRLRTGNITGAMTAFTGSAYDKYNAIFTQLAPSLPTIVDQIGEVHEVTFNLDLAEMIVLRNTPDGPVTFMVYLIRSEDGIWRIDGM